MLTSLSPLPLDEIARTLGVPRREAERALQSGTAQFSVAREVPSTHVRPLLEDLRGPLEGERWPRATIVRRQGTARRRTHTVVGAGVAVAALLVSGTVVASGGAEPSTLEREPTTSGVTTSAVEEADAPALDESALLADDQLGRYGRRLSWSEESTYDQPRRRRPRRPLPARALRRPGGGRRPGAHLRGLRARRPHHEGKRRGKTRTQRQRASRCGRRSPSSSSSRPTAERAAAAYTPPCAGTPSARTRAPSCSPRTGSPASATTPWCSRCAAGPSSPAASASRSPAPARPWSPPSSAPAGTAPDARTAATGLAASVNALCGSPGAGTCAGPPRAAASRPTPSVVPPACWPPSTSRRSPAPSGPWVGTDPERARTNFASTRCDNTRFDGKGLKHNLTRTFLFPANRKVDTFGLTQTVATMPEKRARQFVEEVRDRIRRCGQANLGTTVDSRWCSARAAQQEITVWDLDIEISDSRSVEFLMAIMRDGKAVSQLGFTPDQGMTMTRADFTAVADRALDRLSDLPSAR